MSDLVITFTASVQADNGWGYPDAFVAIRQASESSQKTLTTSDFKNVNIESDVNKLLYRGNYWSNEETFIRLGANNSKPLVNTQGEEPDLFEVDLNTSESINVINGPMSSDEKTIELIRLDVIRRSKQ